MVTQCKQSRLWTVEISHSGAKSGCGVRCQCETTYPGPQPCQQLLPSMLQTHNTSNTVSGQCENIRKTIKTSLIFLLIMLFTYTFKDNYFSLHLHTVLVWRMMVVHNYGGTTLGVPTDVSVMSEERQRTGGRRSSCCRSRGVA